MRLPQSTHGTQLQDDSLSIAMPIAAYFRRRFASYEKKRRRCMNGRVRAHEGRYCYCSYYPHCCCGGGGGGCCCSCLPNAFSFFPFHSLSFVRPSPRLLPLLPLLVGLLLFFAGLGAEEENTSVRARKTISTRTHPHTESLRVGVCVCSFIVYNGRTETHTQMG